MASRTRPASARAAPPGTQGTRSPPTSRIGLSGRGSAGFGTSALSTPSRSRTTSDRVAAATVEVLQPRGRSDLVEALVTSSPGQLAAHAQRRGTAPPGRPWRPAGTASAITRRESAQQAVVDERELGGRPGPPLLVVEGHHPAVEDDVAGVPAPLVAEHGHQRRLPRRLERREHRRRSRSAGTNRRRSPGTIPPARPRPAPAAARPAVPRSLRRPRRRSGRAARSARRRRRRGARGSRRPGSRSQSTTSVDAVPGQPGELVIDERLSPRPGSAPSGSASVSGRIRVAQPAGQNHALHGRGRLPRVEAIRRRRTATRRG